MKTFRLFGKAFLALLMTVIFVACGSDDGESPTPKHQCRFVYNGNRFLSGDTIHITDSKNIRTISWPLSTEDCGFMTFDGLVEIETIAGSNIQFRSLAPQICKLVITGNESGQEYVLNIVIDPMGLDELKKMYTVDSTGGYKDKYGVEYKGPFVRLHSNHFEFRTPRIKIESFGNNYEECYPSNSDHLYSTIDGHTYLGKLQKTTQEEYYDAEYWFFKFTYGNKTYEIRDYTGQDEYLWNDEWNN